MPGDAPVMPRKCLVAGAEEAQLEKLVGAGVPRPQRATETRSELELPRPLLSGCLG